MPNMNLFNDTNFPLVAMVQRHQLYAASKFHLLHLFYTFVCMYVCMYVCALYMLCVYVHECVCVCVCVWVCVCVCALVELMVMV